MDIRDSHTQLGSTTQSTRARKRITEFLAENGFAVLAMHLQRTVARTLRSKLLGIRIGGNALSVGASPRLLGLRHISIGVSFRAGDSLWLEAVTRYGTERFNPAISLGNRVGIGNHVHIGATSRIDIGDDVLMGSRITIIDHNHGIYHGYSQSSPNAPPAVRPLSSGQPVLIGARVWIGDGVVVLPGSVIGAGSIIGANSVVAGNIPANCIATGVPARPLRLYSFEDQEWIRVS